VRKVNPAVAGLFLLAAFLTFDLGNANWSLPAIPWPWPTILVESAPFKTDKPLAILIVEENNDRLKYTAGQLEAMTAKAPGSLIALVESIPGAEMRVLDKDQKDFAREQPWVAEAFKAAQPNMLPWIVVSTARGRGFTKQLPAKAEETVAAVQGLGVK